MMRSEVVSDGRAVAWGEIDLDPDERPQEAQGRLWVAPGHLPRDARRKIVDQVLDAAADVGARRLHITVPIGDGEMIALLLERCASVQTHPAGSTCLIDAELARPGRRRVSSRRQ